MFVAVAEEGPEIGLTLGAGQAGRAGPVIPAVSAVIPLFAVAVGPFFTAVILSAAVSVTAVAVKSALALAVVVAGRAAPLADPLRARAHIVGHYDDIAVGSLPSLVVFTSVLSARAAWMMRRS